MSILGLICVLLALVATLLFVLFLFQRRDLRAVSELSLQIQRAIAGERLPQRIELNPEHQGVLDVQAGQALITARGEWVQYSTPGPEGAEYIAVCLPAFSPDTVHRDA